LDEAYRIVAMIPSAEEYLALNLSVGWRKTSDRLAIEKALSNSTICLCALQGDRIVAFVRVIGDGSITFYIQDLIVIPECQRKGIGRKLMQAVMDFIKTNAAPVAYVGLMAAVNVEGFYRPWGFTRRSDDRPGMDMVLRREE
jgi:ribosomal protein S18 acetylase RimI-like enzyme